MMDTICGLPDSVKITRPFVWQVLYGCCVCNYNEFSHFTHRHVTLFEKSVYLICIYTISFSTGNIAYSLARWHAHKCTVFLVQSQLPYHRHSQHQQQLREGEEGRIAPWRWPTRTACLCASTFFYTIHVIFNYVSLYVVFSYSSCHIVEYLSSSYDIMY